MRSYRRRRQEERLTTNPTDRGDKAEAARSVKNDKQVNYTVGSFDNNTAAKDEESTQGKEANERGHTGKTKATHSVGNQGVFAFT